MIKKEDLIERKYYIGTCRNTSIAMWNGEYFMFINYFFTKPYLETVPYYGDVKELNTDGFIPIKEINIDINLILEEKYLQDYKNHSRKIYLNLSQNNIRDEIWKPILNYEGLYYVSNMGRIKKHDGNKIMKQNFCRDYLVVGLTDYNHKRKTMRVHRLVAQTFKNHDWVVNDEVNHINGIKTDNRDINLEWIKHSENSKHSFISGNVVKKLTPKMVREIKTILNEGNVKGYEIAKKYGVSTSTISEIKTNKKWKNL